MTRFAFASILVVLTACGSTTSTDGGTDSGITDAGIMDAGTTDAGTTDAGMMDAGTADGGTTNAMLSISGIMFSTLSLTVSPGGTITVHNMDAFAHTFTSQSMPNQFVPGAVNGISFDTGNIAGGATATVTIPSTATKGMVIPFFCNIHKAMMGSGTVTIQ